MVLSTSHNQFFPSLLLKIDPKTGEELTRYIHTGIIYHFLTHDIDGDRTDEIIGLGVNNAFNQATVAFVLKQDDMDGHSPLNEEYKLDGYEEANEQIYIQFPRSVVGEVFRNRYMNNSPDYLQINEEDGTILVRVDDLAIREPTPYEIDSAGLLFYFNYDFKIQSIGTDSNYDLWAKNLYEDGLIPFEPGHEYFEAFKDSLLYWDGEQFVLRQH